MNPDREAFKMLIIGAILGLVTGCDWGNIFLLAIFAMLLKIGMDIAYPSGPLPPPEPKSPGDFW